jgi:hypothetical protein
MDAPAIRAIFGLHTPQQTTTLSVAIRPREVDEDRLVDVRHELLDTRRRHDLAVLDAPRLRRGHAALQLLHPLLGSRDLDAAALREHAPLLVLPYGLERELRHLLRVVDREDEVRRVAGRAARVGERALVEEDEVAPAEVREVIGEAVADDARADDDGSRAAREL